MGARLGTLLIALIMLAPALSEAAAAQPTVFPEEVKGESIVIGAVFSLSGAAQSKSIEALCAAKAIVDWVNDRGGIFLAGKRYFVQLEYYDDGGDPAKAAEAYASLARAGRAVLLSHPDWRFTHAVAEMLMDEGLTEPVLIVYDYHDAAAIRKFADEGLRVLMPVAPTESLALQAFRAASVMDPDARVFVVVSNAEPWGPRLPPSKLQEFASSFGVELAGSVRVSPEGYKDLLASIINRIGEAEPDILIVMGERDFAVGFIVSIYGRVSVKGVILASEGFDNAIYSDLTPIVAENVVVVSDWFPTLGYSPERALSLGVEWWGPTLEVFNKYFSQYCPAIEPSSFSARVANAILFALKAIQAAGSTNPEAVVDAALTMRPIMTLYGVVKLDKNGIIEEPEVTFAQLREGKLEAADLKYPAPNWYAETPRQEAAGAMEEGAAAEEQPEGAGAQGNIVLVAAAVVAAIVAVAVVAFLRSRRG